MHFRLFSVLSGRAKIWGFRFVFYRLRANASQLANRHSSGYDIGVQRPLLIVMGFSRVLRFPPTEKGDRGLRCCVDFALVAKLIKLIINVCKNQETDRVI